ncbi:MAG: LCP family protein [Acidimicrobiales bacterium]
MARQHSDRRPTWQRRALLAATVVAGLTVAAVGAATLSVASAYHGIHRVSIVHAPAARPPSGPTPTPAGATQPGLSAPINILLTGSDGRSCIDPASPYAGAFLGHGTGAGAGDRSDTIMILRVDPVRHQLAVLSLPRDLYVPIAGTGGRSRINAAFTPGDPNRLIQTIEADFGIRIDHYAGVDFCAFKSLVDAVGGLSIPFAHPARDTNTGLDVAAPGCHPMAGDEALAYVRSRHYSYNVGGRWVTDTSSDFGRIARQQDFLRRLAAKALASGATNPITAARLLDVARSSDVRIDDGLGLATLIGIGRAIQAIGPANAVTYRIDGRGVVVRGADVILPDLTSPAARSVLAYFAGTGEEPAAGPPDPSPAEPTPSAAAAGPSSPGTPPRPAPADPAVPDPAVSCR